MANVPISHVGGLRGFGDRRASFGRDVAADRDIADARAYEKLRAGLFTLHGQRREHCVGQARCRGVLRVRGGQGWRRTLKLPCAGSGTRALGRSLSYGGI